MKVWNTVAPGCTPVTTFSPHAVFSVTSTGTVSVFVARAVTDAFLATHLTSADAVTARGAGSSMSFTRTLR